MSDSSARKPKTKYQSVVIIHPDNPKITATLDVWFIGNDIVLGGVGWYEYNAYEKLHEKKEGSG